MMTVAPTQIAEYLKRYVEAYRREYRRMTTPPPAGGGYPPLEISPYLYSTELLVLVSADGVAIVDASRQPPDEWWIAGGPALMVDLPDSRTPPEIVESLKRRGLLGQEIGIYRLVARDGIPEPIWRGELDPVQEEVTATVDDTTVIVRCLGLAHLEVLQRLTFGTLGLIMDLDLGGQESDFWVSHIIRGLGFLTADRKHHRFLNYLELSPHTDLAAWDPRTITIRVQADVRRDFGSAFSLPEQRGATISFGVAQGWIQPYHDRLSRLAEAIDSFAALLEDRTCADERVFHEFLEVNPVLLDVYGEPISKPRFQYPEGEGPLGKAYVEPDFILRYPGNSYKLVELERPSKSIATREGQPRAEVTQATFQMAEWKAYIANHYDRIRAIFPGIAVNHSAMVVISRSGPESFGAGRDIMRYKELLRTQYPDIEIVTYDELLERARRAYTGLAALGI